ncbi:YlbF family regulator [Paenibacillus sp. J2TS4]|uniref:YlbF family regulator n=1 Tax=Paenibacillus sp. J2TS4 TaxID=2807194 RepID=UPI001B2D714A|nr:YlbF family regulator [Paenibacillus sp. J2TS4]GIP32925.1 regulator [Paenibacillus sp. J2TS4]
MSILEADALDMSALLIQAYELGDSINSSVEMAEYLYWKERLAEDEDAQSLIRQFAKKKEKFEECERFGHFHPDYHAALEEVQALQEQMHENSVIRFYQQAESRLDELLFDVSELIAYSVSESIKVPSNSPVPVSGCGSGGCGSGGSCSGNCG